VKKYNGLKRLIACLRGRKAVQINDYNTRLEKNISNGKMETKV